MKSTVMYKQFGVIPKGEQICRLISIEELQQLCQFQYQETLCFSDSSVYRAVLKACGKGLLEKQLSPRQKWVGALYGQEILAGALYPGLELRWINPILGYGVFTQRDIPAQSYIGSYTGEIRKRPFWRYKGNDYCFDYATRGFTPPFYIDAEQKGGFVRFVNHSNFPNLESMSVFVGGVMHIILCAMKAIPKGSQLTYDYGDGYWVNKNDPSLTL